MIHARASATALIFFWGGGADRSPNGRHASMLIFPSHAMLSRSMAVSWVDWDDTVGIFNVNFGKFYTWAQLLDDILDFDIR